MRSRVPTTESCTNAGSGIGTGRTANAASEAGPVATGGNMYVREKLFIGGRWVAPESGELSEVRSPATEAVIGQVPVGTPADVDRAMSAAAAARSGPWSSTSFEERA